MKYFYNMTQESNACSALHDVLSEVAGRVIFDGWLNLQVFSDWWSYYCLCENELPVKRKNKILKSYYPDLK